MKDILNSINKKIIEALKNKPIITKLGISVYRNTKLIIIIWSILFLFIFLESKFQTCITDNLNLINIYYVNIILLFIFVVLIVLFILTFMVERYKYDNEQPNELETTLRTDVDNKIIILPIFMIFMFTAVKIYIFFCQFDFSDFMMNLNMIPIILVFLYSFFFWYKYKNKSKQSISFKIIVISLIPIIFICYWNVVHPYIKEILSFIKCVIKQILIT